MALWSAQSIWSIGLPIFKIFLQKIASESQQFGGIVVSTANVESWTTYLFFFLPKNCFWNSVIANMLFYYPKLSSGLQSALGHINTWWAKCFSFLADTSVALGLFQETGLENQTQSQIPCGWTGESSRLLASRDKKQKQHGPVKLFLPCCVRIPFYLS